MGFLMYRVMFSGGGELLSTGITRLNEGEQDISSALSSIQIESFAPESNELPKDVIAKINMLRAMANGMDRESIYYLEGVGKFFPSDYTGDKDVFRIITEEVSDEHAGT